MQLEYGLYGGGHLLVIGTKIDIINFYKLVDRLCQDIADIELVSDRLYKKYVQVDDVNKTLNVMNLIGESFKKISLDSLEKKENYMLDSTLNWKEDTLFDVYEKIFDRFSHVIQMFKYSLEDYGFSNILLIKTVIANIPYTDWIQKLPQEVFDSLKDEEEPLWTWDIDKLKELVKQHDSDYKNVHHVVYVLADK